MSLNKRLYLALGVTAGMLIATNVMADYAENFESVSVPGDLSLGGWGGYGSYSNTVDQSLAAGVPIAGDHNKHLAVDGWVTNTLDNTAGDAQLDMLVKVAKPDEPLSGMSDGEAKFAMAIDEDGTLKYYTGSTWAALGDAEYEENQWIRVAVVYDQAGQRCKVSVNGNACVTDSGYRTATTNLMGGAWYPLLNDATKISSLKVVGTTALDDIKVTHVANNSYEPTYNDPTTGNPITTDMAAASGSDVAIPLAWLDKNNIDVSVADAPDGSGMKVADKYQTGMDPNGGETFAMKDMSMEVVSSTVKATVTVPACTPPSGSIKIQTSTNKSSWTDGAELAPGATSAQLTLESGNVTYFRMVLDK